MAHHRDVVAPYFHVLHLLHDVVVYHHDEAVYHHDEVVNEDKGSYVKESGHKVGGICHSNHKHI